MERLWAPWRMEFIRGGKPEGCVFCDLLKEGKPDREGLVLHVTPLCAVIMNRYPYGHGHLLVMPRRHVARLGELSREENCELAELMRKSVDVLSEAMEPQGFNLGVNLGKAAGAGIEDHLHWHVLPRWIGDVNFLTLVGEVRSIPEHLLVTYDQLRPFFEKES